MLVMTPSTISIMLAARCNPEWRRLQNLQQFTTGILLLVEDDFDAHSFTGQAKGDKNSPPIGKATDRFSSVSWIIQGEFGDVGQ